MFNRGRRTAVVGITGDSNSGKTTFLVGLVEGLKSTGHRVGCIKHAPHGFAIDRGGSDSARLAAADADCVIVSSPGASMTLRSHRAERPLGDLVREITDACA